MHQQTFTVDFGVAGKVRFTVETDEVLPKYHALGAIEVACGELIFQNRALIDSQTDC